MSSEPQPTRRGDVGIIALVPDRWDGVWTVRHHVLHRLGRYCEVVWINPAGGWRDQWFGHRTDQKPAGSDAASIPGFSVYEPGRWSPDIFRPAWLGRWLKHRRIRKAVHMLRHRGCKCIVLYLWRPDFAWALDAKGIAASVYHIDDEYRFSPIELPNDPAEVELICRVDRVIVHSRQLLAKKGSINPHTAMVPNGVDFRSFSAPVAEPADLASIPHPRVGYVGVVKAQLDINLLLELATRRPEWSFVLVGPRGFMKGKEQVFASLIARSNVVLIGNRPVSELPAYIQHMDVCMLCYEVNDYTNYIYPLKLHEYLAAGRPVVSAPIDMAMTFTDVLQIAGTTDEWERTLLASLTPETDSEDARAARRAHAAAHDWDRLTGRIASWILGALQPRQD